MTVKLKRGQKLCKECNTVNAARQRVCKGCGHEFMSKNTPIHGEVKDWKELQKGTLIKVIQGTGPYFISRRDTDESYRGERICMGDTGVFKVISTDHSGILVYGASRKNSGYSYLYMGVPKKSEITGTYLEPYRIKYVVTPNRRKRNRKSKNANNKRISNSKE
jgi:hypothetical protein